MVEKETDVLLAIPLADTLLGIYGKKGIENIRLYKDFYKKENMVCCPLFWSKTCEALPLCPEDISL